MKLYNFVFFQAVLSSSVAHEHLRESVYAKYCNLDEHPGHFLVDYEVKNDGCHLACHVLKPSTGPLQNFWTQADIFEHNLNDFRCGSTSFCVHGHCVNSKNPNLTRKVFRCELDTVDGYFPYNDFDSPGDPYVQVFLDGTYKNRTEVDANTNWPRFEETFDLGKIFDDSEVTLMVMDEDKGDTDDVYGKITIKVKDILKYGLNATAQKYYYGNQNGWFRTEMRVYSLD